MNAMASYPSVRDALVELGGVRTLLQVPLLQGRWRAWLHWGLPSGGACIHRQADRTAGELCRPGGDRDGECATADRAARGAGATDRDRRGVAGDQRLARQSAAGVRRDAGKGDAIVRGRVRRALHIRWGELHDRWRSRVCPPPSRNSEWRTHRPMRRVDGPTLPRGSQRLAHCGPEGR